MIPFRRLPGEIRELEERLLASIYSLSAFTHTNRIFEIIIIFD